MGGQLAVAAYWGGLVLRKCVHNPRTRCCVLIGLVQLPTGRCILLCGSKHLVCCLMQSNPPAVLSGATAAPQCGSMHSVASSKARTVYLTTGSSWCSVATQSHVRAVAPAAVAYLALGIAGVLG